MTRSPRLRALAVLAALGLSVLSAPAQAATAPSFDTPRQAPAGQLPTGPRANGTAVLPSGRFVTPAGRTTTVDLQPTHLVLSGDGKRLYVSDEGLDAVPSVSAYDDSTFDRFVTVLDPTTPGTGPLNRSAHIADDDLHYGMAETPDGAQLWVSEGKTGTVGVFSRSGADYAKIATVDVGQGTYPWGLAMAPDGRHVLVAGFQGNTLAVIDTATRAVVAKVGTGEYPYDVTISPDGKRAYVSNWGLYNSGDDAVEGPASGSFTLPPATIAGYNTDRSSSVWAFDLSDPTNPTAAAKQRIGRDLNGTDVVSGSLPSALSLSPDGATLAVTASNNDLVELRDARTLALVRTIDLRAYSGAPLGSAPNALAWAPDGATLFVALGGRDAVAALDPRSGQFTGLIPTAWYPPRSRSARTGRTSTSPGTRGSARGRTARVRRTAPTSWAPTSPTSTTRSRVWCRTSRWWPPALRCRGSPRRSSRTTAWPPARTADPSGGVLPTSYGTGPSADIQHVVFVLKENRTYDQVFGDLAGTERDQSLAPYSGQVTPNQHALAKQFGIGESYYTSALTSYDGHYLSDTGEINEFATKVNPSSYAGKFDPDNLITNPENLPQGGFLWNNLARAGISFKIYGEATYLVGLGPTALNAPNSPTNPLPPAFYALGGSPYGGFSATYPSQITFERPVTGGGNSDEDRADDFLRDLTQFDTTGVMPSYLQLTLPDDHTRGAAPGAPTPETFVAENDHALGRIVDGLSNSQFWGNTLVIVTEDDTQDGQDHVDASRTFALLAGGHVKRGYVSPTHHSITSVLKTVNLALGAPPTSLGELTATSMADYLSPTVDLTPYDTRPMEVTPATNPPRGQAGNAQLARAQQLQADVPPGIDRGGAALAEVLRTQAAGAAAAGDPNVPPTPDVQEHTLPAGSPEPVRLVASDAPLRGLCGAASPDSSVPEVPWAVALPLAALVIAVGLTSRRGGWLADRAG